MREEQLGRHQGEWTRKGRRCSKCWSKDSPAAHGPDHDEAGVPVKPMEIHRVADIHLQPMEDPLLEKVNA